MFSFELFRQFSSIKKINQRIRLKILRSIVIKLVTVEVTKFKF